MPNLNSEVPAVLTCWKDIAQYLGKGVRTVQRWEQELGLPVRRPNGLDHKSPVAARPQDLDAWLRTCWSERNGSLPIAFNVSRAKADGASSQPARRTPSTEAEQSERDKQIAEVKLQSTNEEMHHLNELLTQLNNDLTNLLNSVNWPMVMVGSDLSVRRFTPQATSMLGLMPSDVGRPIPRLKLKIDVANLEQMMLDVIHEVQPKQFWVQDHEGNWCSLRITPYRTLDNRIDGVVLTVVDKNTFADQQTTDGSTPAKRSAPRGETVAKNKLRPK
jgi:PAS domain-containing protein